MKTTEIRQRFIEYFVKHGHEAVLGSSLVPGNDPTLLFTNSGMVQFKDLLLGRETRAYTRAVTSQRCVRAGGKHNDLENVGYTARHHTFFEMLGNFSFGDYFKSDAIRYCWELLTVEFKLPPEKLWVTVFEDDDDAESIWINEIGMAKERITRKGAKDNFWQMGDTGPCGPCAEIFYDHGAEVAGGPPGSPEQDGDRFVEIWNLVFMQYNRNRDGQLEPLPKPSVDTGMGLERIAAVLQGVHSNYDIDLFQNLIGAAADILQVKDSAHKSLRVIADHIRSTAFLIVDGVIPSNEGRGYVLRRIIRRAIRHGYQLGCKKAFMHKLVAPLVDEMGAAFPELAASGKRVEQTLKQENEKFNETLEQGLKMLAQEIDRLPGDVLSGETVFKLYDTFGFPADLTADIAREHGLRINQDEFESAMQAQRQRARSASQFTAGDQIGIDGLERTPFVGYQNLNYEAEVVALLKDQQAAQKLEQGEQGIVVLSESPFYPQSGGQVGDQGLITLPNGVFKVADTQYIANKVIAQFGRVVSGVVELKQTGQAEVEANSRHLSANNHSATHLLHAALKSVLGPHVEQKGSLVEPQRLRFDFSHFEPLSRAQLIEIESLVNQNIRANHQVSVDIMPLDQAKSAGAAALFGEQYDAEVRVVRMGEFSFELCGGTHVNRTGDIGLFKINAESGVAAGVRRIEALTGESAERHVSKQLEALDKATAALRTTPADLPQRVKFMLETQKRQQRQIQSLQTRLATGGAATDVVKEIRGVKVVAIRQDDADVQSMRMAVDQWRNKLQSGVVLVAGASNGKVTLIAGVSKDLSPQLPAGKLIHKISALVDGKGGGSPNLAQAGGTNVQGIEHAIEATYRWVEDSIKGD